MNFFNYFVLSSIVFSIGFLGIFINRKNIINKTKKMICNHKANGGSVLLASHINLNIEGSKRIFIKSPKLKISNKIANFDTWDNIK